MKNMQAYCRRRKLYYEFLAIGLSVITFCVWFIWTVTGDMLEKLNHKLIRMEARIKAMDLFL